MAEWFDKLKGFVKDQFLPASSGGMHDKSNPDPIGMVKSVKGQGVYAVSQNQNGQEVSRRLHSGDNIMPGDRVVTKDDSWVSIVDKKHTLFSAGPNSELNISELSKPHVTGSLDVATSRINKGNIPDSIDFLIPSSIIGVRG